MDYLLELYNANGKCVQSHRLENPMRALEVVGEISLEQGGFSTFTHATCYFKDIPQWELEIK